MSMFPRLCCREDKSIHTACPSMFIDKKCEHPYKKQPALPLIYHQTVWLRKHDLRNTVGIVVVSLNFTIDNYSLSYQLSQIIVKVPYVLIPYYRLEATWIRIIVTNVDEGRVSITHSNYISDHPYIVAFVVWCVICIYIWSIINEFS